MASLHPPLISNDHGGGSLLPDQRSIECCQQQNELPKPSQGRVSSKAEVLVVVLTSRDGSVADLKLTNLSASRLLQLSRQYGSFSRAQASAGTWDKALRKNEVSTLRMLCFLGAKPTVALGHGGGPKSFQCGQIHVSIDSDGVMVRPLQSADLSAENHSLLYRKILFSHGPSALCNSSQLLHIRSSDLSQQTRMYDATGRPNFDKVYVVSGICLFNAIILRQVKEYCRGKTNEFPPTIMEQIVGQETLYEAEIVWRLSHSITDLVSLIIAGTLSSRGCSKSEPPHVTIKMDVPRLEYYGLGVIMIEKGTWKFHDALAWIAIVDRRIEQLLDRFSHLMKDAMRLRGLENSQLWDLCISNGAAASEELLRESLLQGYIPSSASLLSSLATARSHEWPKLLSLLQEDELPQDIRDLARLSYVYEYLHPILGASTGRQALVLAVDDSDEQRIFLGAQKFLRRHRSSHPSPKHLLLACYPHSRIIIDNAHGKSDIYHNDFRHVRVPAASHVDGSSVVNVSFTTQQIVRLAQHISESEVVAEEPTPLALGSPR